MRVLFLTHSFNSLAQRLFVELSRAGHEIAVELDVNDAVAIDAARLFRPDVILAPYLRRAIPEALFRRIVCLVVHPGIVGDRGPSALDWAILEGRERWGVTVLQANEVMDGGDVWASAELAMRRAPKSSIYRREVTEAAVAAVKLALRRIEGGAFTPTPLADFSPAALGCCHPLMAPETRTVDWAADSSETVLRKIHSADSFPGALGKIAGDSFHLFGAHAEGALRGGAGRILATSGDAVCVATADSAVWITHLRRRRSAEGPPVIKLPAARLLGEALRGVPERSVDPEAATPPACQAIRYEERGAVGSLHFPFLNGAMSADACRELEDAYRRATTRATRVLVLWGGEELWSNGIDLNRIESDPHPAEESWRNILAMNSLVRTILTTESHLVVAALQGNAGAGGVFLALAADWVYARRGIVLNPHYKNMGNLYGSEYWTYSLPRRVGPDRVARVRGSRLPLGTEEARELGLIDEELDADHAKFREAVSKAAAELGAPGVFERALGAKVARRRAEAAARPLDSYAEAELERMKQSFFGFDPSYHVARYNFVYRVPHSRTPLYLAHHRDPRTQKGG